MPDVIRSVPGRTVLSCAEGRISRGLPSRERPDGPAVAPPMEDVRRQAFDVVGRQSSGTTPQARHLNKAPIVASYRAEHIREFASPAAGRQQSSNVHGASLA